MLQGMKYYLSIISLVLLLLGLYLGKTVSLLDLNHPYRLHTHTYLCGSIASSFEDNLKPS
jgi:hypothetical protein